MIYLRLVCLIHIAYLSGFNCYPNGAPDDYSTCSSLTPSHGSSARTSSSPYQIQVSATTITNSGSLTGKQLSLLMYLFNGQVDCFEPR